MATDILKLEKSGMLVRSILIITILLVAVFTWVAVRRQIGVLLANVSTVNDPNNEPIAEMALKLAPGEPFAIWLNAAAQKQSFSPESIERALVLNEETIRAAPYDYRWWLELGRAYEQAGKLDQSKVAFEKALEIAPAYAYSHWQYGNFLLRRGRVDEAFEQLRLATVNNQAYRDQVFSLAWEYFDHDPARLEQVISAGPDVDTSLTLFYAARGFAADALRVWNRVPAEDRAKYPQIAKAVAQGLYEKRYFPEALEFARQLNIDPDAAPESISNQGFEAPIAEMSDTYFGWKVPKNDGKLDTSADGFIKHSGNKSLRLTFRNYTKPDLFTLGQTVVVQPGKNYSLVFWIRTENLRSAGVPQLEIVNANDDKILASSKPFPQGSTDWQQYSIVVSAPSNCSALVIRTTRGFCGDSCPIVGSVWYDDFSIEKR